MGVGSEVDYTTKDQTQRYQLLMGEVKNIVYPNDANSRTKLFIEYDVWVQVRSNDISEGQLFYNCVQANALAGLSDKSYYVLRANPKAGEDGEEETSGSKVLILNLNGESYYPIIISGVMDPEDDSQKDVPHDELALYWNYNGIKAEINNDGELVVSYNGATKEDGSTEAEDSAVGTYYTFDKDGNFTISDEDGKNSFILNNKDGELQFQREKKFKIGKGDEAFVLGTSFRKEQKAKNAKLQAQLSVLENLMMQIGTALTTAGGKMAVPIAGAVSAAVDVAQAGALAITASKIVKQLNDAIKTFEDNGAKTDYKSKKDFTDSGD